MISLVAFFCLLATGFAQYPYNPNQYQPQHQSSNNAAPVHYVNIGAQLQGDYKFGYNTGNGNDGSFREETRNPDGSVSGAYGYTDASGKQKIIRYTAGKDGFKAEGDDIPKAPPAPAPVAPQPQYNPAPYQAPASQYQPQPQWNQQSQPQPQWNQQSQPQPQWNQQSQNQWSNNYVQPQPSNSYSQYTPAQQSGSYNPFSYHNPAPGQPVGNSANQLSYNIGGGQPNHYQG